MKTPVLLATLLLLSACGAETAGTAAVSTQSRKQEVESAKQVMDQIQPRLDEAQRINEEKLRAAESGKQ